MTSTMPKEINEDIREYKKPTKQIDTVKSTIKECMNEVKKKQKKNRKTNNKKKIAAQTTKQIVNVTIKKQI